MSRNCGNCFARAVARYRRSLPTDGRSVDTDTPAPSSLGAATPGRRAFYPISGDLIRASFASPPARRSKSTRSSGFCSSSPSRPARTAGSPPRGWRERRPASTSARPRSTIQRSDCTTRRLQTLLRHREYALDRRQPALLRLRPAWTEPHHRHRVLVISRRPSRGAARACQG